MNTKKEAMDLSEPKLISPLLDDFAMGDPMSNHHGVRCCPAMAKDSDKKYIVKIISIPASQVQLDALLLTGTYRKEADALAYFKALSDDVVEEAQTLQRLSQLEGFIPYEGWQVVPMENAVGYDVYLLGSYHRTLERFFKRSTITHLAAVNLGLDLCAAMAVCRRAGYLYVDLKPGNIFLTDDQEYRIGDLGFVKMDSLQYASLPDKYRSKYTPPEVKDALSSLNETVDIYAIGMILYQAYNGGVLPFEDHPGADPLPPPNYADYEMADIILKACAPNPEDRWQDPIAMGQALVSYMQRNSVNDVPIVAPVTTPEPEPVQEEPEIPEDISEEVMEEIPAEVSEPEASPEDALLDQILEEVSSFTSEDEQPAEAEEEDAGDLGFMDEMVSDETAPSEDEAEEIDYDALSEDISDILNQADELIAHETPDPVVAPDPIEIPMPEPIVWEKEVPEELPPEDMDKTKIVQLGTDPDPVTTEPEPEVRKPEDPADEEPEEAPPKKKKSGKAFIAIAVTVILIGVLLVGGYFFYQDYYIQTIDEMEVTGTESKLAVQIVTTADESALSIVCVDTFGNKTIQPVSDGIAIFENLNPNTIYKITVEMEGFHKLVGQTTGSYTTPAQTNIVQFGAITGSTDGSVVLTFTVDGQEPENWTVTYSAEGEESKSETFTGHMVTLNGLSTGKEYSFQLLTDAEMYISGMSQITYTPAPLVYAENLTITSCRDSSLSVAWTLPEGATVESWTVRCYNDAGFDTTITTGETNATFTDIDCSMAYTVEVTAAGMSTGRQVYMSDNSITVSNLETDISDIGEISISWTHSGNLPEDGWLMIYSIDGSENQQIAHCDGDSAFISPAVPGYVYQFTLQSSDGSSVFGGTFTLEIPEAEYFNSNTYLMYYNQLSWKMCRTPDVENWDKYDVDEYTNSFVVGDKASICLSVSHYEYSSAMDDILISYIIRDENGSFVSAASETRVWYKDMWYNASCYLDIPQIPETPGSYTLTVLFNGEIAAEQDFTVTAE